MTDFNVPKMMGLELCKQVIADNPDALIPMLTAQKDIYFAKQVLKQERVCMWAKAKSITPMTTILEKSAIQV